MPTDLGDVVALSWTALDVYGAPADAGAISITITLPDGSQATPTPTADGAGAYHAWYQTTQSGRHTYRWLATGTPGAGVGVGAYTDSFDVWPALDNTILSLADCREALRVDPNDHSLDDRIREYNASITGVVEKLTGGAIVSREVTERQLESGESEVLMLLTTPVFQPAGQPYPIVSIMPVLTYGLTYDLSLLTVDFASGLLRHRAGLPFWNGPYDVRYWAGRPVIQPNILTATRIILRHVWALERGGAGSAAAAGADDVTMMYGYAIPNRAIQMLDAPGTSDPGGIA